MDVSKTKTSSYRRLYGAHLTDGGLASSVAALPEVTGMPRRTAQATIAALAARESGSAADGDGAAGDRAGRCRLRGGGAIDRGWIERNLRQIKAVLEYP